MRKKTAIKPLLSAAKRKPLVACVATMFAVAAPELFAASTWTVTSCADSGSGSLRSVVSAPTTLSGDTVDLSKLGTTYSCPGNVIALTSGAITIQQSTITLSGPTSRITITGYYNGGYQNDRLINHTGTGGTLYLSNLNFEFSQFAPPTGGAYGGCIYSANNVSLDHSNVYSCHLTGTGPASGGGIRAHGAVSLKYSQVAGNSVISKTGQGTGGGIHALDGKFTATYSTINGNSAAFAGGVAAEFGAQIQSSTISGNHANTFTGGLYAAGGAQPIVITNSTISGNSAGASGVFGTVGGASLSASTVTIQNSTIAFNTAANATAKASPGVYLTTSSGSYTLNIESSILSNNTYGSTENDFGAQVSSGGTLAITSNNNIVRAAPGTYRPATVTTACPLLGPLRDNGGATLTHALLSHSPAIDAGNNNANLNQDQRGGVSFGGPYPYPRQSGIAPDIGAYELQQNDVIFNAGFDGCPVLF